MNPADWILDFDRSLNRCYEEAVEKLDLLFIENSEWIQRRKEAIVIENRKQAQIRKEQEEIERQKVSEKIEKKIKKRSTVIKEPLIHVKKVETKNVEKRKETVPPTKVDKIPKKNKQSKKIPVVEARLVNNESRLQDLPLNKKKQIRSARINAATKFAEHILTDSNDASTLVAPENGPEAPLTISDIKALEEDMEPEEDIEAIKKPIETITDDLILKEPSPIKLIPDLATVHISEVSSPSIPTKKVESWMSQMIKKESLVPIHNVTLKENLVGSKQEPVVQKVSPLKTEPLPEPKPLKLMPKQMSPERRPTTLPKPECYIESPLTRARRIDSQNTWREQQLSKFFVSRSEFLKSSLNALREVKEHERVSLGHQMSIEPPIVDTRQPIDEKSAPEKVEEDEPHFQLEIISGPPTPRIPMRPISKEALFQAPNVIPEASAKEIKIEASPKKTLNTIPLKELASVEKEIASHECKMVETTHSVEQVAIKPTDVFRLVSPLKKKSRLEDLPSIDNSIEAEFVGALNPPLIALVNDIDVHLDMEEVSKQLPDDDVFNVTRKEALVCKIIDKEEEARRERLKERQRLAIERKNMLMKKAQDSKAPKIDDASIFKPKPMMQPFSRPGQQSGSNIARTTTGSTASALHKTAMLNSSKSLSIKTEIKAPPAKIKSPAPIKMAEKILSSPTLPEIPSDDEEYLRKAAQNAGSRPEWAQTPALKAALQDQQMRSAGKVFQNIQPVRLEGELQNLTVFMDDRLTRIAIVSSDKCKPKKCKQECKKTCPVNRMGKLCIDVQPDSKIAYISEEMCIGCGMCVKKCPFGAITIINLPTNLEKDTTHRYSANSFKLHRLPIPRPGQVLGLVGTNGIGKSTALKILAGREKPNLGKFKSPPDWSDILTYFRGSELQNYFTKILEDNIKAVVKPQFVENLQKTVKGKVGEILKAKDERGVSSDLIRELDLEKLVEREVSALSGGELQRFAIAVACCLKADVYMFDEPSSYLDVKQRLTAAKVIRSLLRHDIYVIVVEHDLSVLDYLSDFCCILYGQPSVYGVVSMPFGVREGINIFLDGHIPTENMRFRDESLSFRLMETADDRPEADIHRRYQYPDMEKKYQSDAKSNFQLEIEAGQFTDSEIIVMLGENGTGKTTFIRMLAGIEAADSGVEVPQLNVSYKPQKLVGKSEQTVREVFLEKIRDMWLHPQFQTDVCKPLKIDNIIDQPICELSGGELQRVAITLCLGKPADIYLIDEPSAYLDSEQRIVAAKVIKRFILHAKKTAFVVEHDFIMATYLADRVIVFEGVPAIKAKACTPQSLVTGMNSFLKSLNITFRRDPTNFRPRINKLDSIKDKEQKASGDYFFLEK